MAAVARSSLRNKCNPNGRTDAGHRLPNLTPWSRTAIVKLKSDMTLIQVEKRVKALEQAVEGLARRESSVDRKWYRTHAGRFASDPVFDEIVKLGRAYRKSKRPASGSPGSKAA